MFQITLYLGNYPCLSGCQALDFERQWGLTETGNRTRTYTESKFQASWVVPESFARAYFRPDRINETEVVSLSHLRKGEVVEVSKEYQCRDLALNADISPERAMELFVAARVARLQAIVKQLDEQIEELTKETAEEVA